jgi:hypothetical protein
LSGLVEIPVFSPRKRHSASRGLLSGGFFNQLAVLPKDERQAELSVFRPIRSAINALAGF